ncbi:MAG: hypothetical protein U1F43_26830 [Myxococcota bacterium]
MAPPIPLSALAVLAVLGGAVVGACTGPDPSDAPSVLTTAPERFAVATVALSSARPQGTAVAQAYFVEHPPGERGALLDFLHVPGAAVAFDAGLAVDTCVVTHPRAPSQAVLLDAGELTVETAESETILDSSYIPDGYMRVAGLAYEGTVDLGAHASGTFVLAAAGSDEVGPFAVTLNAPPAVRLLSIGGESAERGRVLLADELRQGRGLAVAWEAPSSPYEGVLAEDVAVVTYERRGFGEEWTVACAVKDDGNFVIPAPALQGLADLGDDATDRVVVRRIAGASFAAAGIPEGLALAISEDAAYVE